jgi:hypothetical protein
MVSVRNEPFSTFINRADTSPHPDSPALLAAKLTLVSPVSKPLQVQVVPALKVQLLLLVVMSLAM